MDRCLVTGGAGFIGSHVVDVFAGRNWEVTVLDNLSFGRWSNLDRHGDGIERIQGDIRDPEFVTKVVSRGKFQAVVHLAALHFIPYCDAHPQETLRTNVEGTENVLSACGRAGIETVFLASSAAVYPDIAGPIPESVQPFPMDVYGTTKAANEHQARIHARTIHRVVAGRFFNAVGARETNPHLVPELVRRSRNSDRIPIGNTSPRRDYVDVRDLAEAVFRLVDLPGTGFEAWNIGTGISHDVVEVAKALSRVRNRPIELKPDPSLIRKVERENLQADISRLQASLGWHPSRDLETMLAYAAKDEE